MTYDLNNRNNLVTKTLSCWPFILMPLAIIYVYIVSYFGFDWLCSKNNNEILAFPLVGFSVLSFSILAYKTRNELAIAMAFLCAAFFCREWHFAGTTKGIYVALAFFVIWFIYRRKIIDKMIAGKKIKLWLLATAACYLFSQLIARRIFSQRHLALLPQEELYHILMEETLEVTAHILMLITSLIAWATLNVKENKLQEGSN